MLRTSSSTELDEHLELAIKQAEAALLCLVYLGNQLWFAVVLSNLPGDRKCAIRFRINLLGKGLKGGAASAHGDPVQPDDVA